jgi:serine phosphatase RsbU (regulator of sigma subunit)
VSDLLEERRDGLTAVIRTAQYLALLRSDADIWRELGQVLVRFFAADVVALLGRHPDGTLASRYCTLSTPQDCARLAGQVRETAQQVLDSGFLASELVALPDAGYAVALLPLAGDHQTDAVLLVGHRASRPLPQPLLDIYLAIAGLFENTVARLAFEKAALESAQRFEEQHRIAVALQENFLSPLPRIDGLEMGLVMQTAFAPEQVGGDFSDVFLLDDSRVAILIGDVAGKGIRAAGLTERVRIAVRAFATVDSSPAFILRKTNQLLLRRETQGEFVTAFLLVLDRESGESTYASAGHPSPVLVDPLGCRLLATSFGVPLGAFDRDYLDAHLTLGAGDCLVFYTDGVTEARRAGELFGETRLLEAVSRLRDRNPQELAEGLRDQAAAYAQRLADDLEVLALRFDTVVGTRHMGAAAPAAAAQPL